MAEEDTERQAVGAVDDFEDGDSEVLELGEEEIAVFYVDGEFHALDNVCTHQGGPLCDGRVEDEYVYCPWHGHQFDLQTGEHGQLSRLDTRTFEVVVEDGQVYVVA